MLHYAVIENRVSSVCGMRDLFGWLAKINIFGCFKLGSLPSLVSTAFHFTCEILSNLLFPPIALKAACYRERP